MRPTTLMLTVLLVALPLAATASAQDNGRGNDKSPKSAAQAVTGFSASERQTIADYFTENVYTVEALPPGIAKKASPPELQSALALADGYELVEVGLDVFLVEVATNIIHDVLMDLIR